MPSISSQTAYVLLSSIEEELRSIVEQFCADGGLELQVPGISLETITVRRQRDGLGGPIQSMAQVLPYLDFQDAFELANAQGEALPPSLRKGIRSLTGVVGQIALIRNRVAHNRPLDIDDLPCVVDFANDLLKVQGWAWPRLQETTRELASDPGYIFRAAAALVIDPENVLANNLPSPDFDETSLLGRREERRQLLRALNGSWPVISILGDGGIGKTALALQVCYDLIQQETCQFEAVVWVTAKNSQLTSTEIVRIESAVEDSLGLFASAAATIGGTGRPTSAISELLSVLESFPTLLVLDNVETVLDENFPAFLREIPQGSKVLITSRIGVKTENPFSLKGLSPDDSVRLMRIIAKSRGIDLSRIASTDDLSSWARKMNFHPAYIKWFMSGLQSGQRPESLLSDNGLVLDFCMSNVYDYLTETARTALRAMLVVPGSHTIAELAFLTELDANTIQKVSLELTTTNFVAQVRSGSSGTALELSDFAKAYLRRTLTIGGTEREALTEKQKSLYLVGGGLKAAHVLDPFSPSTIDIRGVGDYSAAKLLRDALELAELGQFDDAFRLCSEAAELAPGYHEGARVEGRLHELSTNFSEAFESYSRARDLAPEDPYVAYFFGKFLSHSGFNLAQGLRELQRAASLKPDSSTLQLAVADAHIFNGDLNSAIDAAAYALKSNPQNKESGDACYVLWRSTAFQLQALEADQNWAQAAEDLEYSFGASKDIDYTAVPSAALDLVLWCEGISSRGAADCAENFIAGKLANLAAELKQIRGLADLNHINRVVGIVDSVNSRGFGFISVERSRYFFHASALWDRRNFDELHSGSVLAFTPGISPKDGKPQAQSINWIG